MRKILIVMSAAGIWERNDGSEYPTGYRAEELDRNLFTGQNPASSAPMTEAMIGALK